MVPLAKETLPTEWSCVVAQVFAQWYINVLTPASMGPSLQSRKLFSRIASFRYTRQTLGDEVIDGTGGTGGGAEPESLRAVSRRLLELALRSV